MSKVAERWFVVNSSLTWSRTVFFQTYSLPTGAVGLLRLAFSRSSLTSSQQRIAAKLHFSVCYNVDLSAAFDTVDHDILIGRLYRAFGFRDDVLSWITSFVTGRTQRSYADDAQSAVVLAASPSQDRPRGTRCRHLFATVICHPLSGVN